MPTNGLSFLEVVENERLIFAYFMTLDGAPLPASLVTVEIRRDPKDVRLVFTEQGACFDGNVAGRKEGTRQLLESRDAEVVREAEGARPRRDKAQPP